MVAESLALDLSGVVVAAHLGARTLRQDDLEPLKDVAQERFLRHSMRLEKRMGWHHKSSGLKTCSLSLCSN